MLALRPFLRPFWSMFHFLSSTLNSLLTVLRLRASFVRRQSQKEDIESQGNLLEQKSRSVSPAQLRSRRVSHRLVEGYGRVICDREKPTPPSGIPTILHTYACQTNKLTFVNHVMEKSYMSPRAKCWPGGGGTAILERLPSGTRLQWSRQAAEALTVLHDFQVMHCDLSPRNFLLDSHLNVKIADFGGASLCGAEPSATPATRFRHPGYDWNVPPVFGDDIFSLGSLVYFIMTGSYPYGEVPSDEVEKLYEFQQFPDVCVLYQLWSYYYTMLASRSTLSSSCI